MTSGHDVTWPPISMMICGAQKAGTTALKNLLGQHPQVRTHRQIEFTYFVKEEELGQQKIYARYFNNRVPPADVRLVAKCARLASSSSALLRLKQHNPRCRLVFILRHPVERLWSGYLMEKYAGWTSENPEKLCRAAENYRNGHRDQWFRLFVEPGIYSLQIENLYHHFPKEQVHLFRYEDLKHNPVAVCRELFSSLLIDPMFVPDTAGRYNETAPPRSYALARLLLWFSYEHNPIKKVVRGLLPFSLYQYMVRWTRALSRGSGGPESMPTDVYRYFMNFYADDIVRVQRMTGLVLDHWLNGSARENDGGPAGPGQ